MYKGSVDYNRFFLTNRTGEYTTYLMDFDDFTVGIIWHVGTLYKIKKDTYLYINRDKRIRDEKLWNTGRLECLLLNRKEMSTLFISKYQEMCEQKRRTDEQSRRMPNYDITYTYDIRKTVISRRNRKRRFFTPCARPLTRRKVNKI